MTPQDWQTQGSLFNYRGHPVFFRQSASPDKPTLLLIHGFPTASWDWEPLWEPLSKHFQLIALDMMGFGFSAKPTDYRYSIFDQADLCEALLRHLNVTDYHVLSHDYGDTVAQELLARQSTQGHEPVMQSLCLLNGGLFPEVHRPLLVQKLLASRAGPLLVRFMKRSAFKRSMRRIFGPQKPPSDALITGFWELLNHQQGLRVMPSLLNYLAERRQHRERWVGALQQSRVPLHFIVGCKDPISGEHMAQRYATLISPEHISRLPRIGHYPQVEDSTAVLGHFMRFHQQTATHPSAE